MDNFEEYVEWLIDYLEAKEMKEIINYASEERQSYYCELAPKNRVGDETVDEAARPNVEILINKEEKVAQLRRIYLNKQRQGVGTKIVNQLIEFCNNSGIREIWFCDITNEDADSFFWKIGYDYKKFSYVTLADTYIKVL